jgi:solute carrier family 35, member E1
MTTTTVLTPSPTRLSFLPQLHDHLSPHQQPMENAREKFPSFEELRSENKLLPVFSPQAISPAAASTPGGNWPARKSSQFGQESKLAGGLYHHRPKRSVSEAFDNFRQRRGSISANTHELAEALKAPISYKLIVSPFPLPFTSGHSYR